MLNVLKYILNLIYPPKCIFCKDMLDINKLYNQYICDKCYGKLPIISDSYVSLKNRDIDNDLAFKEYYFRDCISKFFYEFPVSSAICDFKFHNKHSFALPFAKYLASLVSRFYADISFDFVTYIPMFKRKEFERSYNQAKLLAMHLSKTLKIPLANLLIKVKNNSPQHNLNLDERKDNIKGVYEFSYKEDVSQKNILLVDDIVTSGYTLNEASKILVSVGVANVYCVTIAAPKIKNKYSLRNFMINNLN